METRETTMVASNASNNHFFYPDAWHGLVRFCTVWHDLARQLPVNSVQNKAVHHRCTSFLKGRETSKSRGDSESAVVAPVDKVGDDFSFPQDFVVVHAIRMLYSLGFFPRRCPWTSPLL